MVKNIPQNCRATFAGGRHSIGLRREAELPTQQGLRIAIISPSLSDFVIANHGLTSGRTIGRQDSWLPIAPEVAVAHSDTLSEETFSPRRAPSSGSIIARRCGPSEKVGRKSREDAAEPVERNASALRQAAPGQGHYPGSLRRCALRSARARAVRSAERPTTERRRSRLRVPADAEAYVDARLGDRRVAASVTECPRQGPLNSTASACMSAVECLSTGSSVSAASPPTKADSMSLACTWSTSPVLTTRPGESQRRRLAIIRRDLRWSGTFWPAARYKKNMSNVLGPVHIEGSRS